jgi:D-serine deaminase-like pyridoxal phosphate-dependent protein
VILETVGIAGTGTAEIAVAAPAVTEIQPGSFVLMDYHYSRIAPAFACALTILTTVISGRENFYGVLDAGSQAISQDYEPGVLKDPSLGRIVHMGESHTRVEGCKLRVGDQVEVIPGYCRGTMNLHRHCVAIRAGEIAGRWAIEASGRHD